MILFQKAKEIDLPKPNVVAPSTLAKIMSDDKEERLNHTYGKSFPDAARSLLKDFSSPPDLVAFPNTEDELISVMDWCDENNVAVIPYGGDIRESDGRMFWGYNKGQEDWRKPASFCVSVAKRKNRNQRLREIRGRWLDLYKMSKGCQVCGYKEHPVALEFDHINKADKVIF